ncbi:ABC transporter substrate-binding protein [Bradyrhizobium sp. 147]|uniref:ABC transporter substrate-binding protein n=1 Tax=Bradyrhizobium sp. 147 TaxID=2782623 RepID=UPI001FFB8BBE|nr:ABC transporter substrate-binding protein [Bradyrhizobium sp. 147]MCK1680536.1 ABC transporter substrate-binding protein [Bradyrhizobium sp. 147]
MLLDGLFGARFAGEMIADKEGFFPPNVVVRANPDDPDFVATVAREHAIGVTSGQKFLLGVWRGIPVTAFAASLLDTSSAIFTWESSGLRSPADLVGKRIGYRRGSEGEVLFDVMMAQLGLPRSQIVKVPYQDGFDALRSGAVDAVIAEVGQEFTPSAPDYGRLKVIKPQDYGIHAPGLVYFASSDLLQDCPSTMGQVLESLIKGWKFVYDDYSRSVTALVSYDPGGLSSDRVRLELQQQRPLVVPTAGRVAEYDESRWKMLRDALIFAKLGEETVPISQAVTYQVLRDVYRQSPNFAGSGAWSGVQAVK